MFAQTNKKQKLQSVNQYSVVLVLLLRSTPEEREEWLRVLWNAIEENSERYHTFKAKQSEPKVRFWRVNWAKLKLGK